MSVVDDQDEVMAECFDRDDESCGERPSRQPTPGDEEIVEVVCESIEPLVDRSHKQPSEHRRIGAPRVDIDRDRGHVGSSARPLREEHRLARPRASDDRCDAATRHLVEHPDKTIASQG